METLTVPRILITSLGSGTGKSLLTLGLTYELRRRGISVSCAVLGSRMIQALFLRRASGRYTRSISSVLLSKSKQQGALFQAGVGADILLVEGGRGFFDGDNFGSLDHCDAEFSRFAGIPPLLVVDAEGLEVGLVPIVEGFKAFFANRFAADSEIPVYFALNRADRKLRSDQSVLDNYQGLFDPFGLKGFLGGMAARTPDGRLPPDTLTEKTNLTLLDRQFLIELGEHVQKHVDIDALLDAASQAGPVQLPDYDHQPFGRRCRIAVSEDSCFVLGFQDNQDLLRYYGAEVVPFSPLADSALPRKIGAVYLSGGYISDYADELARNTEMKRAISDFAANGGVLISEGAGTAYLCDEYIPPDQSASFPGVGLIPAAARFSPGAPRFVEWVSVEDSIFGGQNLSIRGIVTGEWSMSRAGKILPVFRYDHDSGKPVADGWSPGPQIVSSFGFFHLGSNPAVARNIVDAAEVVCKL